ncbi:MAG: FkbM family methyltransferase [Fimbriimonas sp.]
MLYGPHKERVWEPNTALLLELLAHRGRHFLVAGGHVGYFPLLLATRVNNCGGTVHTFEPNDRERGRLERNVTANNLDNVTVDSRALYSRSNELAAFHSDDVNVCSSLIVEGVRGTKKQVLTVRIDDYCSSIGLPSMDGIILDIEGGEPEAIYGCQRLLEQPSNLAPDIVLELVPGRRSEAVQNTLLRHLLDFGYRLYVIEDAYDYDVSGDRLDDRVMLHEMSDPTTNNVARIRAKLGLPDPNIFATKRGVARFGRSVAVIAGDSVL